MLKRLLVAAFVTALVSSADGGRVDAREADSGYAGLEFYGSSQISRVELEKLLGIKPGASAEAVNKAASRLQEKLEQRRVKAHVDVAAENGRWYITVDVMDTGVSSVPIRKLQNPHKVYLSNEMAFTLFDQLLARREQLAAEGRPVTESFNDGSKSFTDEPCNQIAQKLARMVPYMHNEFLAVLASDPDPARRSRAIEVLNWDADPVSDCAELIASLDDGAEQVRVSAARFILPRIQMLPDNFPIPALVEIFSHQLQRPSHIDRVLALRCLAEIARSRPFAIGAIKAVDEAKLKELDSNSILASIKQPAQQLLNLCNSLPADNVQPRGRHINEF
jgi:hypothetical protein